MFGWLDDAVDKTREVAEDTVDFVKDNAGTVAVAAVSFVDPITGMIVRAINDDED